MPRGQASRSRYQTEWLLLRNPFDYGPFGALSVRTGWVVVGGALSLVVTRNSLCDVQNIDIKYIT